MAGNVRNSQACDTNLDWWQVLHQSTLFCLRNACSSLCGRPSRACVMPEPRTLTWERWGWTHRRCPRREPCCGSPCRRCRARGAARPWLARWPRPPSAMRPGRTGWTRSWTQTAQEGETRGRQGDWEAAQTPAAFRRSGICLYEFHPQEYYQPGPVLPTQWALETLSSTHILTVTSYHSWGLSHITSRWIQNWGMAKGRDKPSLSPYPTH